MTAIFTGYTDEQVLAQLETQRLVLVGLLEMDAKTRATCAPSGGCLAPGDSTFLHAALYDQAEAECLSRGLLNNA